jgi:hypothetical protein
MDAFYSSAGFNWDQYPGPLSAEIGFWVLGAGFERSDLDGLSWGRIG